MVLGLDPQPEARRLLVSVAEQLKVPLSIIARQAELSTLEGNSDILKNAKAIGAHADAALLLVDSYLLGIELLERQSQLELEPVPISSLAVDMAHELYDFARQYDVTIELQTSGRFGAVMGNARGLKAAILSLGLSLIEAQAVTQSRRVILATHRTPKGIVTGLYGASSDLTTNAWSRALSLYGVARQPLSELSPTSGAGLFIADTIFRSMNSHLRVGHFQQKGGLAATLQPSRQLQFV